jgi:uncharacterized repeat protein (TIGR02543 family)
MNELKQTNCLPPDPQGSAERYPPLKKGLYDNPKITVKLLNRVIIGGMAALIFVTILLISTGGFVITFDSNGGTDIEAQKLKYGEFIEEPAAPMREGYEFTGWYVDPAAKEAWNFSADPVSQTMTLYAGWQPVESEASAAPSG